MPILEIPPDVDHKTGPSLTNITGNFRDDGEGSDLWTWSSGSWPTGDWKMFGTTTQPVSGTTWTTNAQEFIGNAGSISPSGSGTSYQIWYRSVRVGHVFVNYGGGAASWWMYQTSYSQSGPYLPTASDTYPLEFKLGTAVTGTGWQGTNS